MAADLPVRGPVYKSPPPVVYNWTGFYGGVNVGYSWGRQTNDWTVPGFFAVSEGQNMNGVVGGVQWGYNWQIGNWVLGTESDFQGSAQRGSTTYCVTVGCGTTVEAEHKLPWFGTSRTRIGYLPSQILPALRDRRSGIRPGEVGLLAVHRRRRRRRNRTSRISAPATPSAAASRAPSAAAGARSSSISGSISARTPRPPRIGGVVVDTYSSRVTDNIVRIGLNYKLGGGIF